MKFFLFVLAAFSFVLINNANEEKWLKPSDYFMCENNPNAFDVTECNSRWPIQGFTSTYKDYACCYVQYKDGERTKRGCYIVQDSKTGRKKYHSRVLNRFDDVKIICAASFTKISAFILLLALLF